MKSRRFEGKVALITGSATGIGEACAYRFAEEGADLVLVDTNGEENEQTATECRGRGSRVTAHTRAVEEHGGAAEITAGAVEEYGRLDILVCSAGIYSGSLLPEVTMEQWSRMLNVNLTGVFLYNQAAAPHLKGSGGGSIINISSMAGKTSWQATAEYSSAKTGVIGLTRSVAMELGPFDVTVNAICPGNTVTAMVKRVAAEIGGLNGMSADEWLNMRADDTALKRLAEPWEIAGVTAFLASEDARYLTGQAIEVDGGIVLS